MPRQSGRLIHIAESGRWHTRKSLLTRGDVGGSSSGGIRGTQGVYGVCAVCVDFARFSPCHMVHQKGEMLFRSFCSSPQALHGSQFHAFYEVLARFVGGSVSLNLLAVRSCRLRQLSSNINGIEMYVIA